MGFAANFHHSDVVRGRRICNFGRSKWDCAARREGLGASRITHILYIYVAWNHNLACIERNWGQVDRGRAGSSTIASRNLLRDYIYRSLFFLFLARNAGQEMGRWIETLRMITWKINHSRPGILRHP